jgi:phosphopantetheine adenylyltransferase
MFVLTVDQQGSQSGPDRVPALTRALEPCHLRLAPERTAGDEIQMLAEDADEALAAFLVILEEGGWSIGVGIGPGERPLPTSVRAGRGEAFVRAREAVEAARRTGSVPVCVRVADPRQQEQADELEALLRVIGWFVRERKPGQWRVVRTLREDPGLSQQEVASRLGVTQQTVSRALATSGWREQAGLHPLARRLLAILDLTGSRTPSGPRHSAREENA